MLLYRHCFNTGGDCWGRSVEHQTLTYKSVCVCVGGGVHGEIKLWEQHAGIVFLVKKDSCETRMRGAVLTWTLAIQGNGRRT
jgi:hypothetical protein